MTWKFFDPAHTVAFRQNEDGTMESCLVAALSEDVEVEPYTQSVEEQKNAINAQRDIDLLQGVTFDGSVFHSDDAFRADLTDMIMGYDKGIFPANSVQNIRTKENTIVQLNFQQLIALKLTIGQMRQTVFAASWAAKDTLDNPQ